MFKPYGFDVPTDVADELIPAFNKAGFYFESAVIADTTWFAVIAQSDKEAFALFTLALSQSGCIRQS